MKMCQKSVKEKQKKKNERKETETYLKFNTHLFMLKEKTKLEMKQN